MKRNNEERVKGDERGFSSFPLSDTSYDCGICIGCLNYVEGHEDSESFAPDACLIEENLVTEVDENQLIIKCDHYEEL